jgi:uncharacterized protein (TIGR02466 family)
MTGSIKHLFSTPLWAFELEGADVLNRELLMDGRQYKSSGPNFLDLPGYGIQKLKEEVNQSLIQIADDMGWKSDNNIEIRSRQSPIDPGKCDSPHYHQSTDLIGVYYVKALDGCGDTLLHDTRGAMPHVWQDRHVLQDPDKKSGRVFYRIKPKAGTLLFFPSYVIHSVETNFSSEMRISIVFNISFPDYR